jgi:nucleotide-binding universal stress UspA family protein
MRARRRSACLRWMQPAVEREPVLAALCPATAAAEPLDFGLAVSRVCGAPLVVVAVTAWDAPGRDGPASSWAGGTWRLDRALERRAVRQAAVRVVAADSPARGLAQAVDELAPRLIALGLRRGGHAGRLGTTARRVVHVSSCPVALVPAGYRPPAAGLRTIGAAFTPTAEGERALRAAAALASAAGGRLWAIAALDAADQAEGVLRDALSALPAGAAAEVDLRTGEPADGLVVASRRLDLLVLGSRASGPPGAVRLGGVSRTVVDRAECPLLLVPRAASPRSDDAPAVLAVDGRAFPPKEER